MTTPSQCPASENKKYSWSGTRTSSKKNKRHKSSESIAVGSSLAQRREKAKPPTLRQNGRNQRFAKIQQPSRSLVMVLPRLGNNEGGWRVDANVRQTDAPAHSYPTMYQRHAKDGRKQRTTGIRFRAAPLSCTTAEVFVSHKHCATANKKKRDRLHNMRKTSQTHMEEPKNTKFPIKTPAAAGRLAPSIRALTFLHQTPSVMVTTSRKPKAPTELVRMHTITYVTVLREEFSRSLHLSECSSGRSRWNLPHLLPLLPTRRRHAHPEDTRHTGRDKGTRYPWWE